MGGFIKLRRGLRGHWIMDDPYTAAIFLQLLLSANWSDRKRIVDGNLVELKRGEWLGSMSQIAAHFKLDRGTVRRRIEVLENAQVIHRRNAGKYTIFTITKYDYDEDDEQGTHKKNTGEPTRDAQEDPQLQKKNKEIYKKEKKAPPGSGPNKTNSDNFPKLYFTDEERAKLKERYSEEGLSVIDGLEVLQGYAENNARKFNQYKSHYRCMITWVLRQVRKTETDRMVHERNKNYLEGSRR